MAFVSTLTVRALVPTTSTDASPVDKGMLHFQDFVEEYPRYRFLRLLGQGSFGVVGSFIDQNTTGINYGIVAVKKIKIRIMEDHSLKFALREIKILKHLAGHPHISDMIDFTYHNRNLYIISKKMKTDLAIFMKFPEYFGEIGIGRRVNYLYQLLLGIKTCHGCGILHRDIKPSNILLNSDLNIVKIADFGMPRSIRKIHSSSWLKHRKELKFSSYVTTRWYRAPELIISDKPYNESIDMWSIGCVFAEMLLMGQPLFFGVKNDEDHVREIRKVIGTPSDCFISLCKPKWRNYFSHLKRCGYEPPSPLYRIFQHIEPAGLDLLQKLLKWDPAERLSVDGALQHPYFNTYYDPKHMLICDPFDDTAFENSKHIGQFQTHFLTRLP